MKNLFLIFFLFLGTLAFGQNKIPSKEVQLKATVQAAPEMFRDDATVIGYDKDGKLTTLKEGANEMVCLANDPEEEGISIACYSDKLADFMKRGRDLVAEGKSSDEKKEIRKKEIDNGTLKMPEEPAALYVLSAEEKDFDTETGEIKDYNLRYVLYKPYMTTEETGLPNKPQASGMPWLMEEKTHRSHIMITPK